jgi:hypothetical protein
MSKFQSASLSKGAIVLSYYAFVISRHSCFVYNLLWSNFYYPSVLCVYIEFV